MWGFVVRKLAAAPGSIAKSQCELCRDDGKVQEPMGSGPACDGRMVRRKYDLPEYNSLLSEDTFMKKAITVVALAILLGGTALSFATETEHVDFRVLPAPGKVVIDGKADDWDLSGSLLICSDVENYRNEYASWQSAMYDAENLYLLSRWIDTTPLNNPGLCGSDMGFPGDCLQVRIITSASGRPTPRPTTPTPARRRPTSRPGGAGIAAM